MLLVTGADHTHGESLIQLLESVRENAPGQRVIVYDLGLTANQRNRAIRFGQETRTFDYSRYPAYFDIRQAQGEYAWKPTIINEVVEQGERLVFWMDAGNVITKPLWPLAMETRVRGLMARRSLGTVRDWTHPRMLEYLRVPPNSPLLDRRNFNAAAVGFNANRRRARELLAEWARLAAIRACIAPEGSDRSNHRQDQALLTVLAYLKGFAPHSQKTRRSFETHRDVEERQAHLAAGLALPT